MSEPVTSESSPVPEPEDRYLTIPNVITLMRLLCIPLFAYLLLGLHETYAAGALLAVLGSTDWVDGYVARHLHQVSTVGKVFDPITDRLLLVVAITAILIDSSVPRWVTVMALVRELLVLAAIAGLALAGVKRIDVHWVGKAGTFGLMVSFPLLLVGSSDASWHELAKTLGWLAVVPALILSYYAAFSYVPEARKALMEGRQRRKRMTAS